MARHPFTAVNLISDPIHGYVELTKRLSAAESRDAGRAFKAPNKAASEADEIQNSRCAGVASESSSL